MPKGPQSFCNRCRKIVSAGATCDCRGGHANTFDKRSSPRSRGYSSKWDKKSKKMRKFHAWCEVCGDNPTDYVHHIVSAAVAPDRMLEESNLVCVCSHCHGKLHGVDAKMLRDKLLYARSNDCDAEKLMLLME